MHSVSINAHSQWVYCEVFVALCDGTPIHHRPMSPEQCSILMALFMAMARQPRFVQWVHLDRPDLNMRHLLMFVGFLHDREMFPADVYKADIARYLQAECASLHSLNPSYLRQCLSTRIKDKGILSTIGSCWHTIVSG